MTLHLSSVFGTQVLGDKRFASLKMLPFDVNVGRSSRSSAVEVLAETEGESLWSNCTYILNGYESQRLSLSTANK